MLVSRNSNMWLCFFLTILAASASSREIYKNIGYFWHITDIHYDPHVNSHNDHRRGCWRAEYEREMGTRQQRRPMGRYGDYSCDSPWELIESAAQAMTSKPNDNVEFVLWTGDALSHQAMKRPKPDQLDSLKNLTELLRKTFSSSFVFPSLGHDDPIHRKELVNMWSRWLPTDSSKSFEAGGYYIIERKTVKLQIVVLNTNLMKKADNDEEAKRQWEWLNIVLQKFQSNGETVYLVGHMPPGSDERQRGTYPPHHPYSPHHNRKYLKIVRKFADTIVGQFFGHLHSDTFRVIYNDHGRPASWAMLAPAITPKRTADGPNNPGLRRYKFDKDTGQIFDYTQYYLDLSSANANSKAEWVVEYNFSSYYNIYNITALSLHHLAEKLSVNSPHDNPVFGRYYRANSVRFTTTSSCEASCAHTHYCAITRVDFEEFHQCLKAPPSALASSIAPPKLSSLPLILFVCLVMCKM